MCPRTCDAPDQALKILSNAFTNIFVRTKMPEPTRQRLQLFIISTGTRARDTVNTSVQAMASQTKETVISKAVSIVSRLSPKCVEERGRVSCNSQQVSLDGQNGFSFETARLLFFVSYCPSSPTQRHTSRVESSLNCAAHPCPCRREPSRNEWKRRDILHIFYSRSASRQVASSSIYVTKSPAQLEQDFRLGSRASRGF